MGKLSICVSDPANGGIWCSKSGQKKYFVEYKDSENYICMPEKDANTLLELCYGR